MESIAPNRQRMQQLSTSAQLPTPLDVFVSIFSVTLFLAFSATQFFFSYLYKFFSSICFFQHFFVIEILCLLSSFCSIGIEAWIKQSFRMTSVDRMCWIIGTLTDGESKINLRFRDISKPQSFDLFQMGDKVQVEGFVDVDGNLFLFEYFSN